MDRPLQVATRAAAVVCIGFWATGCGGGGSSPPTPAGQAPVITTFTVSPSWVTTGQTATLRWSVTGATSLAIDPGGSVSGTNTQVTPAGDATYVLTATNSFGSTQAHATLAVFPPPTVWFEPFWDYTWVPSHGSSDYFDLFSPTAPWANAAAHVSVFKLAVGMLPLYDDATFKNMFADLRRRHIALAIEWGALQSDTCGIQVEGFDGGSALYYAHKIRDLGGSLNYIALDEPYSFGAIYTGPSACNWTPDQIAQNAAAQVAQVRSVFPDVIVGDIEVVPSWDPWSHWLPGYQAWLDAWKRATGTPFAFFHFDVPSNVDWRPGVAAMQKVLSQRGIPFGVIYNALSEQSTDSGWVKSAEQRFEEYENRGNPMPDQIIFQSWDPNPKHLLPETDPTSFTHLINRYFRDRTKLTLTTSGNSVQGALTSASNSLAGASIVLSAVPLTGEGRADAYTYSGQVPAGTQYVDFGARVAIEDCGGNPLPADFLLTDFTLDAGAAGQLHADFKNGLTGWGTWGNPTIAQVEQNNLHVQVLLGQTFGLNNVSLPFTAAGAAYTLTVNAIIPVGSRGEGCAIAVFQDANFTELARASLEIVPQRASLGTVQTNPSGAYTFSLAPRAAPYELWADYAGAASLWPASAWKLIGMSPALAITASPLPDGTAGSAYAQTLTATGGLSPYLWVGAGAPPGLVLGQDGTLSGTPKTAGAYNISVSVVDDSAPTQVVDSSFTLVIH